MQTPFTPVNDILSQSTLADACGISGIGANGDCRFYNANASGGKVPDFVEFGTGTASYKIDWNNVAPNVGVAWRPNVQGGWLRTLLGDPEQTTVRAGYSVAYDRQGMGGLHQPVRREPRQHAEPDAQRGQWAARPFGLGSDMAGAAPRLEPAARARPLPCRRHQCGVHS